MLHLRSHALHGMVGGLAAGFVVALWFFLVDVVSGQLLRTPVLLARVILGLDSTDGVAALASPQLVLGYTVIHFATFAFLGAVMAMFLAAIKIAPSVLLGAAFGVGVLSAVYYLVLLITGRDVLNVLPAPHVLGANLLGGVVLMLYLHRATHSVADFGPEVLRHHRLVTEGLITGLYGAAAVAVVFLVFDALTRVPEGDVLASYREALARVEGRSLLSRLLYLNAKTYLLDDLLPKMDRMSMAHALETRSPFLDRALAQYVATLPDDLKRRGRHGKVVLKKAVADLLPSAILGRKKHGFGVPLGAWFRAELRPLVQDTLLDGSRVGRRLDAAEIRRIFDDHVTGRADRGHQLWTLLTLELWMRKHAFS